LAMHLSPKCGCPLPDDRAGMPTGIDGEWPVPDARGRAGAPKGNKRGCYSAEAIASRREVAAPIQPCALWPAGTEEASSGTQGRSMRSRVINSR
jgi:hypothetical protein